MSSIVTKQLLVVKLFILGEMYNKPQEVKFQAPKMNIDVKDKQLMPYIQGFQKSENEPTLITGRFE